MNPTLIKTPFAENGNKNIIQELTPVDPNNPTWDGGYLPVTSQPVEQGGLPIKREDMNGVLNAISSNVVHLSKGLSYEFDSDYAQAIGGYPLNSRLVLTNGIRVRCVSANNVNNPNTDMAGWEIDSLTPSSNLSELTDKAVARTNLDVYSKAEADAVAAPMATETVAGKAKIATTAIAQAGINDADFITAKKLDSVVIGCNQKLNNVTASRVANTYYLNTNNRAIEVILSSTLGAPLAQFTVTIKDLLGAEVVIPYLTLNSSIGLSTAFSFILSKGESYKLNVVPNLVLERV